MIAAALDHRVISSQVVDFIVLIYPYLTIQAYYPHVKSSCQKHFSGSLKQMQRIKCWCNQTV